MTVPLTGSTSSSESVLIKPKPLVAELVAGPRTGVDLEGGADTCENKRSAAWEKEGKTEILCGHLQHCMNRGHHNMP